MKRLNQIFDSSEEIIFDDLSKFIIMSDCHRGTGGWADTFSNNSNVYFTALNHYLRQDYTYIELGDGDELWENVKMSDIIREHSDVFWLLSEYYKKNRLYLMYGNHDMVKKKEEYVKNNLTSCFNERLQKNIPLFEGIKIHEGLVLKQRYSRNKIFLVHGNQVDFLNSNLWLIARFLVRFLWKPLETFGVNDITRTAKNYE
jgi:UDP-2,3-diacylglucosamine pyrophosphatase LpxH